MLASAVLDQLTRITRHAPPTSGSEEITEALPRIRQGCVHAVLGISTVAIGIHRTLPESEANPGTVRLNRPLIDGRRGAGIPSIEQVWLRILSLQIL